MKKLIVFLALVPVMIFSLSLMSNAQIMNNDQTLNARQQSIITIAAFTANGDIENLRNALNDGLDVGTRRNARCRIAIRSSFVNGNEYRADGK
jgi:hypothetical protein